jgi:hypothetical protein
MKKRRLDRLIGLRLPAPVIAELEAIALEHEVTVTEAARLALTSAVMQHVMGRVATTEAA